MRKQRSIIAIAALLSLTGASTPALAAGPLLSGYGGPGVGNQAILGSALLNTPRGGPPADTGGASGSSPSTAATAPSTPDASGSAGAGAPRSSAHRAASGAVRTARPAAVDPAAVYLELERSASEPSGLLGLTGEDLAYVLIGLAVLAFGALFTRRIVRAGGAGVDPG
jgi:hypothetical protein